MILIKVETVETFEIIYGGSTIVATRKTGGKWEIIGIAGGAIIQDEKQFFIELENEYNVN
jgi:hypothetical protein